MLIYTSFFLSLLIVFITFKDCINIRNGLIFLLFFILSAIRFDVGTDFDNYYYMASGFNEGGYTRFYNDFELGSYALIKLSHFLESPQIFFIISSFITLYCILKTIFKYSHSVLISTIMWLSIPIFFFLSLNGVRQWMAVAIIFFGYQYIQDRKFLKYLICVFLASMFHKSALIALPFYFISTITFNRWYWILFLAIPFALEQTVIHSIQYLFPNYNYLIVGKRLDGGNIMKFLVLFVFILLLIFKKNYKNEDIAQYNLTMAGCIMFIFFQNLMGDGTSRIGLYGLVFSLLSIPLILNSFKPILVGKCVTILFCYTLLSFSIFWSYHYKGIKNYVPYQTFFWKTIDDLR